MQTAFLRAALTSLMLVFAAITPVSLAGEPPLIARSVLFGNPDKASPQISPDGKHIAWLAATDGVMNVWVAPSDNLAAAKAVTADKSRGIRQYFWAFTNQHIIYLQDEGGDENWRVYATDLSTGKTRDLTPVDEIPGPDGQPLKGPDGKKLRPAARIQEVSPHFANEILIGLNQRSPQLHDIYRLNILTGERKLIETNDQGFAGYFTDDQYAVRLAMRVTRDGGAELLKRDDGKTWTIFATIPQVDSLTTMPEGFSRDGKLLYMADSRNRDTGALTVTDLASGESKVIAEDPRADVGSVLRHPMTGEVQAVSFEYDRERWVVLDKSIEADFDKLRKVAEGDFSILSRTLDDRVWIVAFDLDYGPARYFRFTRDDGKAQFLFTNRSKLEGLSLARMQTPIIKSRDGLNLVSLLSLPPGAALDASGKPKQALPMVLLVHGGPWARDNWGYNPQHQWLANRGYAVLSVNFRGSTGFGKQFVNAGNREWAGKMHDDLIDAVDWAVREGYADKSRIAIMGGSYGGYSTLVGLTFTPDVFACGVDIVGPSNLVTLLNSIPRYWEPIMETFTTRIGDHRTEDGRAFLMSRSPLTLVGKIQRPLLIGQGANDPRVKQAEADQIVGAMRDKKIPVTYVLYPDEGHGFARPENRMSFNAIAEAFLAKHLGGRFEPFGEDFRGSSVTVPNGADQVPGLNEALPTASRP